MFWRTTADSRCVSLSEQQLQHRASEIGNLAILHALTDTVVVQLIRDIAGLLSSAEQAVDDLCDRFLCLYVCRSEPWLQPF